MRHLVGLSNNIPLNSAFFTKATGRYYTHELVAKQLIIHLLNSLKNRYSEGDVVKIIDPFAGDGRLIYWLIQEWNKSHFPNVKWEITLWDINNEGLKEAKHSLNSLSSKNLQLKTEIRQIDAFELAQTHLSCFDIVISNPPWELLKPNQKDFASTDRNIYDSYIMNMREYDCFLKNSYPTSQPNGKFAGWGTNLSRVGLDVCKQICKPNGLVGIVMPASFLADDQSIRLRKELLTENQLINIAYFPSEARLFENADVEAITILFKIKKTKRICATLTKYDKNLNILRSRMLDIPLKYLERTGYNLPISFGDPAIEILMNFSNTFNTWKELEGNQPKSLWAGREMDETRINTKLESNVDGPYFIKGRMINRYIISESPLLQIKKNGWCPPNSVGFSRIAWRDVSRPNQKRRMIATIIPKDFIAGNSLGIAYFRDNNQTSLRALLGVMSSLVFEFQLRCHLATSHISLSSLRKVFIPPRELFEKINNLEQCVQAAMNGDMQAQYKIEAISAKYIFALSSEQFSTIIDLFPKIENTEKNLMLKSYNELPKKSFV
jgi:Alw26I/Eco31I/Esp3I family type II restriction m6 adenine DNA methyltransferase